ncbi:hypothetical protein FS837_008575 [Tulasnella sp. UAMH 9824]|nr:hypothetical protein FS837_008575 [Tulasnella sp. UAMH 9824]
MAATEPNRLEFRGQDAEECETFINAVSRYVLSIGKQRDDQGVADFAFSCFTHNALRWWNTLDDDTQGSWKLLRKAMLSRYRPLFFGGSGEEAEVFIHMVRERALDEGKQSDNDWIVGFASACFVGEALRWHASLEPSVQTDWISLQQALLLQYPRNEQENLPNLIPTPAAAAAAPSLAIEPGSPSLATEPGSPSLASESASPALATEPATPTLGYIIPSPPTIVIPPSAPRPPSRRGRIRATKDWDSTKYYVDLSIKGAFTGFECRDDTTLIVGWDWPCSEPQALTIHDSSAYDLIGTRIRYLSQMELVPMRRKTGIGLAVDGAATTDVFKGWEITVSASGQKPGFDLVPMNEEGTVKDAALLVNGA